MTRQPKLEPFAAALQRLMDRQGLDRPTLAAKLGLTDPRKVAGWLGAEYAPRRDTLDELDDILDAGGELHALRGLTPPATRQPTLQERLEVVEAELAALRGFAEEVPKIQALVEALGRQLPPQPPTSRARRS